MIMLNTCTLINTVTNVLANKQLGLSILVTIINKSTHNYTPVEGILCVAGVVVQTVETDRVGLILRPKELRLLLVRSNVDVEMVLKERLVFPSHMVWLHLFQHRFRGTALVFATPDPRVSVPERRE